MKQKSRGKEGIIWNIKGQLTVFIIIAILLVVVVMLIFMNRTQITAIFFKGSVSDQLEKCVKDSATEAIEILKLQGGSIDPKNYILYEGNKVDYLCYTEEYYQRCVMQKPLLLQSIKDNINSYMKERTNACFNQIKDSYEKEGYIVSFKNPEAVIEINPGSLKINVESDFTLSKDKTESYKYIKTKIESDIYEFAIVAGSIANWEARYGDSETMMYMRYYPQLKVEKKTRSDGSRVYILSNRNTKEKFIFAIRSVAFPPGITGN